jgi:hypothetical protein
MDYLHRLQKLHRLHEDPSLRCCPRCDELLLPPSKPRPHSSPSDDPEGTSVRSATIAVACPSCQHVVQEEPPPRRGSASASGAGAAEAGCGAFGDAVPCSHCGMAIHKDSGCDHVVCPSCHLDMCYRCRTHLHLTGKVIRSCSRCQRSFVDHRYNRQYRLRLLLTLPFLVPGWVLYGLATALVAVLTGCFCGCFLCGTMEAEPAGRESLASPASSPPPSPASTLSTDSPTLSNGGAEDPSEEQPRWRCRELNPWLGIRRTVGYILLPVLVFLGELGVEGCGDWVREMIKYDE